MSDLISRQEIDKKLIGLWDLAWGYDIPSPTVPEYVELHEAISAIMNAIKEVRREIDELPSAERKGKWIEDGYQDYPCVCSYCGTRQDIKAKFLFSYCPNCGSDNRGEEDD